MEVLTAPVPSVPSRAPRAAKSWRSVRSIILHGVIVSMKLCLLVPLAATLTAAPLIRDILPHGAQRGKTLTLHIRGSELPAGAKLQTTLPAGISRLVPSVGDPGMNADLPFLLSINPGAPVGLYPIRVLTKDGISNLVLFSVGDLPEVDENEVNNPKILNNTAATAEKIAIPTVINGTLTEADEDYYAFTAKAGQKLVFEVEARRAGSAIDSSLELQDAALPGESVPPHRRRQRPRSANKNVRFKPTPKKKRTRR